MAITIQQFDGPPVFIVSRVCLSMPEAKAAEAALKALPEPSAWLPEPVPREAPPLSLAAEARIEREVDAEDVIDAINFDKPPAGEANP